MAKKDATLSLVDRLEAKYSCKDEFFTVHLPDGEEIKFRNIRNLTERKELRDFVRQFGDLVENGPHHPSWTKHLPINRDVAESLAVISFMSVEPKFSELDVLRLHSIPEIADLISFQIQANQLRITDESDVEEIEESKKDSAPTNSEEQG